MEFARIEDGRVAYVCEADKYVRRMIIGGVVSDYSLWTEISLTE